MACQQETCMTDRPPAPSPRPSSAENHMYASVREKPTEEGRRAVFRSNDVPSEMPPPYKEQGYVTPM